MSNKMLIDASHPEETRVAVVRGNRIEEFDFESQEKKQLRGNIYLAKVTRVEPSLQAAFVDYGGNRHGFLAFSEIHPDYYQIPIADRQALLEAEAEEARAMREAEEAEDDERVEATDNESDDVEDEDGVEEKPKPRSKRRTRTTKKAKDAAESASEDAPDQPSADSDEVPTKATASNDAESDETATEEKKPARKKRTTRRTTKKAKSEEEPTATEAESDSQDDSDDDADGAPETIAAIVETDSISEPLPDDEESADEEGPQEEEAVAEKKPPRKRRSRAKKKSDDDAAEPTEEKAAKSDEDTSEADAVEDGQDAESADEAPKKRTTRRRSPRKKKAVATAEDAVQEETDTSPSDDETALEAEAAEPAKAKRGRRRKKVEPDEDQADPGDVESVGQEDALEELPTPARNRRQYKIQEVIKRRQVMLIQVVKEERGNKGAALTTYLSLAGRYSVLMPNTARGGGISRKITSSSDRRRLKAIASELDVPEGMGVILRTAGASRTKDEIERDFQYLMRLWEQVRNLTLASTAPCLVYEEGSLIKRSIRDLYNRDTGEILVAGDAGYQEARSFMEMLMPEHVEKIQAFNGSQAIFTKYGVEAQLDNMVSPQVTLKSGGYLVINQTEALVAVDVNSGRATREHSVEKTALQTNLEAAEEVSRQLRLRDLAGLIVIDFIDMEERRNNRAVEKKLKDCLKNDRARIQVGRISHFGLLEMSRQRMRASVLESTMNVCPHCMGTGYVRSESAIALHVFRALEEHVERHRGRNATVFTTPKITAHILNHKRAALVELETRYGIQIVILSDHSISGQDFRIEKGEKSRAPDGNGAVGYDGDASADEDADGGRRKRGRRRKRRDQDVESAADAPVSDEQDETWSEEEDEDGKSRKRRRRGRRGGRKRRDTELETAEANGPEPSDEGGVSNGSEANVEDGNTSDAISTDAAIAEASEEPEQKPRTRSTRRKKAPVSALTQEASVQSEPSTSESEAEAEAEATAPPPRARRRTTRRVKQPAETEAQTASDANDSDGLQTQEREAEGQIEAESQSQSTDEPAEDADQETTQKERRGWWNRGSGFF